MLLWRWHLANIVCCHMFQHDNMNCMPPILACVSLITHGFEHQWMERPYCEAQKVHYGSSIALINACCMLAMDYFRATNDKMFQTTHLFGGYQKRAGGEDCPQFI